MEINDQPLIDTNTENKTEIKDNAENITMKIQKTRKKYNKGQKIDANKTRKENKIKKVEVKQLDKQEKKVEKGTTQAKSERLNEKLLEMLEKMSTLMNKKGDNMRSRIYSKAADTILSQTEDITNIDALKTKANIGPTIIGKMKE